MTKKQILKKLIELEEKYHLLSDDAIHSQEDLFEIQAELCQMMAKIANDIQYSELSEKLPYLFGTVDNNGS